VTSFAAIKVIYEVFGWAKNQSPCFLPQRRKTPRERRKTQQGVSDVPQR